MNASAPTRAAIEKVIGEFGRSIWRASLLAAIESIGEDELSMVQLAALLVLARDGEKTVGALAGELSRSLSATSRLLDALVARDLVHRAESGADRRAKSIAIARGGQSVIARMEHARVTALADIVDRIPRSDRAEVLRLMSAMSNAAATPKETTHDTRSLQSPRSSVVRTVPHRRSPPR